MDIYSFPGNLAKIELYRKQVPLRRRIRIRTSIIVIIAGMLAGFLYTAIVDGFGKPYSILNGITVGAVAGVAMSYFELILFRKINRSLSFTQTVIVRSLFYFILFTVLIVVVTLVSYSLRVGIPVSERYFSQEYQDYLRYGDFKYAISYGFIIAIAANFLIMINRKLGPGILWNYLIGKYHKPREEERIFMFMDINDSTAVAERLGHLKFHHLLNDFFYDISDAISATHGEIYQYVGDEIVVSWKLKKGLKNANCIHTVFYATDIIENLRSKYIHKYGLVPAFKAAFHCGNVTVGEIGRIKTEIVYNGDVVNTTARMEKECSKRKKRILLSGELLEQLPEMREFQVSRIGEIQLAGKANVVHVYALDVLKREMYYITPNKLIISSSDENVVLN